MKELKDAWDEVLSSEPRHGPRLTQRLKELAIQYGVVAGKWLFFLSVAKMEQVWPEIAEWIFRGDLPCDLAKVGFLDSKGKYLCCVYMENCFDEEQVEQLRRGLESLLSNFVSVQIRLKPDSFTHCRIYAGNPWNVPVSLACYNVKVQRAASCARSFRTDLERLEELADAVDSDSWDGFVDTFEHAKSSVALIRSLHAAVLQAPGARSKALKVCAALPLKALKFLTKRVFDMLVGASPTSYKIQQNILFKQQELLRMYEANVGFLHDLVRRDLIPLRLVVGSLKAELRGNRTRILPPGVTWAFLQQKLRELASSLVEDAPELEALSTSQPVIAHSPLSILSLNLSFDSPDRSLRTAALLSAIQQMGPVICCFQEVVPQVARDLMRALPRWSASDPGDGSSVKRYGVMIMVPAGLRVRFSRHQLPTNMDRQLLVAELAGLSVATVHLESLQNQALRKKQLAECAELAPTWPEMVLLGDFNFHTEAEAKRGLQHLPDFLDVWPTLFQEPGGTYPSRKGPGSRKRLDRALAKLSEWHATDLELIFDEPSEPGAYLMDLLPSMHSNCVSLTNLNTCPTLVSDHLGLLLTIDRT